MAVCQHGRFPSNLAPLVRVVLALLATLLPLNTWAQTITNLQQLTQVVSSGRRSVRDVAISATVCAASRPKVGILILQDESGAELLQMGGFDREFLPGDRVLIRANACLLRKREMGVEISASPLIDVDGMHSRTRGTASVTLPAGRIPLQLEWFNNWQSSSLDLLFARSNESPEFINDTNLWHAVLTAPGQTNFLRGLQAECYEGSWQFLPDFNLLKPVKVGTVTNFDLRFRSRNEMVALRYTGFLEAPLAGQYRFELWSDDGAMLFLGSRKVPVVSLGHTNVPIAEPTELLESGIASLDERRWVVVEGRVSFISQAGEGVRFEIGTDRHVVPVRLADASGLDLAALLNSRVRVTGIGCAVLTTGRSTVFGKLFAANAANLVFVEPALGSGDLALPIRTAAKVQSLSIDRARSSLPVRLRGIVTGANSTTQEPWMSFQDDTRGIFVRLPALSDTIPAFGELWEVEGHSGAGNFAPIVIAEKITRLGEGLLPPPVKPTWTELLNGSRDVQWAELQGLVAGINGNIINLHLPEGRLDVELEGRSESELKPFLKALVRIRGVLYAVWDPATREVRVGRVAMRNSAVSVDVPAPIDPFDAVPRTPRELLLFDAQASAFRPVKVRGQITYADARQLFLEEGGTGLRLLPVESTDMLPGDLVEAVGYPDIGKAQLLLSEVRLRKTGEAPLPQPRRLEDSGRARRDLNATRIHVEAELLGWHAEGGIPVLEMQSGDRFFQARIARPKSYSLPFRSGSRLALEGVYVGSGPGPGSGSESFELLLNSPADITVLSQPSWWTLPRLLTLLGVLLVILIFTVIWNSQLRRLVEQRTHQLQHEIRERERVERKHALEAERSRIARDLHDDLGSSLTEISVLASTGQLHEADTPSQPGLFGSIGAKARSLISALDVIVWAVDPEDNSVQSLADYLSGYTAEFFAHTAIACRFKVPVSFPPITLDGRVRHEILMAVKEALNNVVRHADATEVEFRMAMAGAGLEIDITDNGRGLEEAKQKSGHGLRNLSARLQKVGGDCMVEPGAGKGTIVKIRLSLATSANLEAEPPPGG